MSKTVLIGVTGCIAAYKSAELVRAFQKAGYRVKVVMTEHATHFVDPLTFRSLTHEPVAVGLFDDPSDPIHHISLAEEADAFVIAPCTANVAAKIAHGIADDLLTTTALACTAPLLLAPAMNVHMYEAQITQDNLRVLMRRGVRIVEAGSGYLACGDVGKGRLAELDDIVSATVAALEGHEVVAGSGERDLDGKHVLVTAGPTHEPIDPVRYIGNNSSGKMGYAIAQAAADRGASVTLISGPVSLEAPSGVELVRVTTAQEMLSACEKVFDFSDIAVFSAAVADYRPEQASDHKLKKSTDRAQLEEIRLVQNPDILATLAAKKRDDQFVVGFAAETEQIERHAKEKLVSKHADMIVGNRVGDGQGFGTEDNEAVLVTAEGSESLPKMPKRALADIILSHASS